MELALNLFTCYHQKPLQRRSCEQHEVKKD
jgi:hypothetical protein